MDAETKAETRDILNTAVWAARQMFLPTLDEFLAKTNGRARTRTFIEWDYARFIEAIESALNAAACDTPYYAEATEGGVANAYKYMTTTARWGVWVEPETHVVQWVADRPTINGRHVGCVRHGGERQYHSDWRKAHETELATA